MIQFFEFFEKNRKLSFTITISIAIAIFLFSSIPGQYGDILPETTLISLIYHFSIFLFLTFFLLISIHGEEKFNLDYTIIAIIISIFYAILDEVHQSFIQFRYSSIGDILIDGLGILVAGAVYIYLKKKK